MSIQFGRWNFEGAPIATEYIDRVSALLSPYGPDSGEQYADHGVRILYRGFHTTRESHCEKQPYFAPAGVVITWDGRLDNRQELINKLGGGLTDNATDVEIVSAASNQWGTTGFLGHLVGDWALAIFNLVNRSLLLARDPIGTRALYYSIDAKQVTWSTLLDPLVLCAGKTFGLCEEYVAGWFSHFPAPHLTPYHGIDAVPPASYVLVQSGRRVMRRYWDLSPQTKIRYRTDVEYEEHFRKVFSTAVERRLRSDRPILSELSGGLDSSSIVCVADRIVGGNPTAFPRLDTISWYADTEPDLDERPYFSRVEEKRGRVGFHIDLASLKNASPLDSIAFEFANEAFAATPIPTNLHAELYKQYATCMRLEGHRVVLSGIGGDEVTGGGVPSPIPELQDLLRQLDFTTFIRQVTAWAEKMRTGESTLVRELIRETVTRFFGVAERGIPRATWFNAAFVRRNRKALAAYPYRLKLFGSLPSFQDRIDKLDSCQRFVSFCDLRSQLLREVRFPFLDRDLLEFMCAIPREQIVRVGRRRSLLKRSLLGVVPDEVLNRKRKIISRPRTTITQSEWSTFRDAEVPKVSERFGFVDSARFHEALEQTQLGSAVPLYILMKTRTLEFWLRHLMRWKVLDPPQLRNTRRFGSLLAETRASNPPPQAKKVQLAGWCAKTQ